MTPLQHVTLNTGNLAQVVWSRSLASAVADLRPVVQAGGGPILGDDLWHLHIMPLGDGAAMMQIADEPGLSKAPVVMGIVAWQMETAEDAWRMVLHAYESLEMPLRQVRLWRPAPDMPALPWLAVWLLPHISTADHQTLMGLGRVEQAAAWILMGESSR